MGSTCFRVVFEMVGSYELFECKETAYRSMIQSHSKHLRSSADNRRLNLSWRSPSMPQPSATRTHTPSVT